MRRVAWVLVGLAAGCWRENPAFLVDFPAASTGPDGASSGGPGGGSTDMTPETGSTGGTSGHETTGEPGTTAIEPDTTGATSTTGEPDTSTGTTGPVDEATLCAQALAGDHDVIPLRELGVTMCDATWRSSDLGDPNNLNELMCPSNSELGMIDYKPLIAVFPDVLFPTAMLTAPRKSPTGTIEGTFPPTPLLGAEHPCLITRLGCPAKLESCSLQVQISIKSSDQPDFDPPVLEVSVDESGPVEVAISLADFKDQSIDVLLVAANDGVGLGNQEIVAWELPWIVEVVP